MSMYPITCAGGFAVPVVAGKMEITGLCATVDDPTAASYIALVDDENIKLEDKFGKLLSSVDNTKYNIVYLKGLANVDTALSYEFAEPVKTRHGISIFANNLKAGSVCVYRR